MKKKFPPKKPDNSHIVKVNVKHDWSVFQKNVFKSFARDTGHLIVEAYAGSGKTTTIIESFKYVPRGKKILALSFGKAIQEELKARAPSYVSVLTFHSLGLMAIKQRFGNAVELDDSKVFKIVKSQLDDDAEYDLITNICDTVAFCKYGLQDTPSQIDSIIDNYGIDICDMDRKQFISAVIKTLGYDKADTAKIDYNDMCYFPFVYNLPLGTYHLIAVDEYQDLNKSQLVMAKKACAPDGRIVLVGDSFQSLYSWRMADTSIANEIRSIPSTKILPLPISYRCPKSIIKLAKNWVPDITCPDNAIEGEIKEISLNEMYKTVRPGCFILSRVNSPLIKICMALIRNGIRSNIRGRDVSKQLGFLIKKSKKKQIGAFLKWLDEWKDAEIAKLKEKNINTDNVLDRVECLTNLCDECKTLDEVNKKIDELFNDTDEKNMVILSTTHRVKGLERDDVYVLRWTYRVWFDQMGYIEKPNEEANIAYVSASRSRNRLFIVNKFGPQ